MPAREPVSAAGGGDTGRKRRGDFPTPPDLVARVVDGVLPRIEPGATVDVLDPACGDGRFLAAAAERIVTAGGRARLHGVELDAAHAAAASAAVRRLAGRLPGVSARVERGDALRHDWAEARYDLVVGNPPFLSQLAAATTRGGSSRRGGGPYADVAAEFLQLAVELARPGRGRIGLVLPQSILASRDVGPIRRAVDDAARRIWSWWSPAKLFDAAVVVCALGFERRPCTEVSLRSDGEPDPVWADVVADALGVPALPVLATAGTIGDRARLTADFRDQYYGLVPAVTEGAAGARLVTSGLIDPLRCCWGERPTRFGRRRFDAPVVELDRLDDGMRGWAESMLVPKVLVANQSPVVEAVADARGEWLPSVPIVTARPSPRGDASAIAAVLTSPVAAAAAWRAAAGTGLSAGGLRLTARLVASLPWPAGDVGGAVAAARAGDVVACGRLAAAAYGLDEEAAAPLLDWWRSRLPSR